MLRALLRASHNLKAEEGCCPQGLPEILHLYLHHQLFYPSKRNTRSREVWHWKKHNINQDNNDPSLQCVPFKFSFVSLT